jgi:hypothetical protein
MDDLLGRSGDRHQAGGALPIDRHASDRLRHASTQRGLTGNVEALRALLQRGAHDNVIDLGRIDAGALDGVGDGMAAQRLALRVVEGTPVGAADGGAGGGDDDSATHRTVPCCLSEQYAFFGVSVEDTSAAPDRARCLLKSCARRPSLPRQPAICS